MPVSSLAPIVPPCLIIAATSFLERKKLLKEYLLSLSVFVDCRLFGHFFLESLISLRLKSIQENAYAAMVF
jgi:hypothetical protein